MNKPLFYISAPFDTYSGYGARSRDVIKSIIKSDKYNVKLLSQRWGNTPWEFIENHKEEWGFLVDYLHNQNDNKTQPDIWMQITVPNEFQPVGKYNIGMTAGMETTIVDASWIEGINRMDINFVSSEHSKKSFIDSKFEKQENGQRVGIIEVQKPIEVLFEGANLDIYKPDNRPCSIDFDIPESFAFLFVGHWMQGNIGEDRKNVGYTIKSFLETFKNTQNPPALIMKVSGAGSSYMDKKSLLKRYHQIRKTVKGNNLPNVYMIHGELSNSEMNEIYNHSKVKAMVSLTKGEGFGRPLLEFSLSKKPIMVSGWSGHMDFLNPEFNLMLGGVLKNVDSSAVVPNMILPESQWFSPDPASVGNGFKDIHKNYKKYLELAKRQAHYSKTNFSWEKMDELLSYYLDKNIPKFAKQVTLNLPNLNTSNKLELPKLKK
jgi:glycosyltransferase involved in cell wall biosynthesis